MAMKLAEQKGLSQADAIQRERSLNTVLDKEIGKYGVDSQKVRETYSGLSRVEKNLAGRRGDLQSAPMGIGKLILGARIGGGVGEGGELQGHGGFISEPLHRFGQAGQDILAGRGWWSGSPADISVREGFRVGGEKPTLGGPSSFLPRGLFSAPAEQLGGTGTAELAHPEMFSREPIGRTPETTTQRAPSGQMQRVYMGTSKPLEMGRTAEGGPIYEHRSTAESIGKQIEPNPAEEYLNSLNRNVPEVEENDFVGPRINASGEPGGGGLEEQSRLKTESGQGVKYFRENTSGQRQPLEGLGRQDLRAGPGQRIIRVDANGGETVLDAQPIRLAKVRPYRK